MSYVQGTAIVTGGNSGIGLQTSRNLLLNGVNKLAIFDIVYSHDVIDKLKCEFPKCTILFRKTDVTNRLEVESSFKEIFRKYGNINVVVNCAGIFDEQEQFERTISVNLLGVIYCTQTAVNLMSREKGGNGGIIVNVSSVCGLDSVFAQPIYNATKHGIVGFTRSLGNQFYYDIYGIKFVVICPGITSTQFMENLDAKLYRPDAKELTEKLLASLPVQSAEVCGKLLVNILDMCTNGSVWIIDDGQVREVILKNHWLPN